MRRKRRQRCPNLNHRRDDTPVRFCPDCGYIVNENIIVKRCSDAEHAESRRGRYNYCLHCGLQLMK